MDKKSRPENWLCSSLNLWKCKGNGTGRGGGGVCCSVYLASSHRRSFVREFSIHVGGCLSMGGRMRRARDQYVQC